MCTLSLQVFGLFLQDTHPIGGPLVLLFLSAHFESQLGILNSQGCDCVVSVLHVGLGCGDSFLHHFRIFIHSRFFVLHDSKFAHHLVLVVVFLRIVQIVDQLLSLFTGTFAIVVVILHRSSCFLLRRRLLALHGLPLGLELFFACFLGGFTFGSELGQFLFVLVFEKLYRLFLIGERRRFDNCAPPEGHGNTFETCKIKTGARKSCGRCRCAFCWCGLGLFQR